MQNEIHKDMRPKIYFLLIKIKNKMENARDNDNKSKIMKKSIRKNENTIQISYLEKKRMLYQ